MEPENSSADDAIRAMAEDLKTKVTEYLEAFILVGYTADGERISIAVSQTEQQSDALAALLNIVCDDINDSVRIQRINDEEDDSGDDEE